MLGLFSAKVLTELRLSDGLGFFAAYVSNSNIHVKLIVKRSYLFIRLYVSFFPRTPAEAGTLLGLQDGARPLSGLARSRRARRGRGRGAAAPAVRGDDRGYLRHPVRCRSLAAEAFVRSFWAADKVQV